MKLAVGAKTDIGRVREGNEDSYFVDSPMFAVADGMGGHLAGDVASATAVEVIRESSQSTDNIDAEALAEMLRAANRAIWEKAGSDSNLRGMGTTCTLALLGDDTAQIAHVGDSRAYLFRDGSLKQVTQDHTLVGRLVREGKLRPEEAERHPQRSIITRALGVDEQVDVDLMSVELADGDRLLLCSDGLSAMISSSDIEEVLRAHEDPQSAAENLVEKANEAGGEDNITVVVIDVGREGDRVPAVSEHVSDLGERSHTDPSADTGYHKAVEAVEAGPESRRWLRAVIVTVVVIALLGIGGYVAARYALDNSWFVGVDQDGVVTIYRGIPDKIAGITLKEAEERSTIELDSLPDFKRDEVEAGIKVGSLEEAEQTLADLERLASDEEFRNPSGKNDSL